MSIFETRISKFKSKTFVVKIEELFRRLTNFKDDFKDTDEVMLENYDYLKIAPLGNNFSTTSFRLDLKFRKFRGKFRTWRKQEAGGCGISRIIRVRMMQSCSSLDEI